MLRILCVAALACLLATAAEARERHTVPCVETGSVMRPVCDGRDNNPFSGARSIKVTIRKERHAANPRPRLARETASYSVPGVVRSISGATAHVAASATHEFQCLVDRLDAAGYPVRFMGGWRAHGSVPGSLHPAGLALDVNQISRNVTRPAMPSNEVALASSCGLVSGAQWANGDSGHFQLGGWAGGGKRYASRLHHRRYASAR